jgi:hypothetical protein
MTGHVAEGGGESELSEPSGEGHDGHRHDGRVRPTVEPQRSTRSTIGRADVVHRPTVVLAHGERQEREIRVVVGISEL